MSLATTWELARAWYGDRLDPAFRGRTADEAQRIFRDLGLDDPFWRLDALPG